MKNLIYMSMVLMAIGCLRQNATPPAIKTCLRKVRLPQIDSLRCEDYDVQTVHLMVDKAGMISLAGTPFSSPEIASIISRAHVDSGGRRVPIHIVADREVPFDKVWELAVTLRSNRVYKLGFAVTDEENKGYNVIDVLLPRSATDPEATGILLMKANAEVTQVSVSRTEITVNGKNLPKSQFGKAMTALSRQDPDRVVVVVPSSGLTHDQLVDILAECRKSNVHSLALMGESQSAQPPSPGDSSTRDAGLGTPEK